MRATERAASLQFRRPTRAIGQLLTAHDYLGRHKERVNMRYEAASSTTQIDISEHLFFFLAVKRKGRGRRVGAEEERPSSDASEKRQGLGGG